MASIGSPRASESPNCLSLLREFTVNKKEIIEITEEGRIKFGELSWPKTAKTNYAYWRSGLNGKPKDYYTLEALLFLLKNVELSHILYLEKTKAEKIPPVRRPDRKALLAYLNGEKETAMGIDENGPKEKPIDSKEETNLKEKPIKLKRGNEFEGKADQIQKRKRI